MQLMAMGDKVATSYRISISRTDSILYALQTLRILMFLGFPQYFNEISYQRMIVDPKEYLILLGWLGGLSNQCRYKLL